MKNFIFFLIAGFFLPEWLFCMEAPGEFVPQKNIVTIKTNDSINPLEDTITQSNGLIFTTIADIFDSLGDDLSKEQVIELINVSAEQWTIIKQLFFDLEPEPGMSISDVLKNRFLNLDPDKLLKILSALDYLNPTIYDGQNLIDLMPLIVEKIKLNLDDVIALLSANNYEIPNQKNLELCRTFLINEHIVDAPGTFERVFAEREDILDAAWSSDNFLAIGHKYGAAILSPDRRTLSVGPSYFHDVMHVAWSPDGHLAATGKGPNQSELIVRSPNGEETDLPIEKLTNIFKLSWSVNNQLAFLGMKLLSHLQQHGVGIWQEGKKIRFFDIEGLYDIEELAWSSRGELALMGPSGCAIRRVDTQIERLDTVRLGYLYNFAWSPLGRLVVVGENGLLIRDLDGNITFPDVTRLHHIFKVLWSPQEELGIIAEHERYFNEGVSAFYMMNLDHLITPIEPYGPIEAFWEKKQYQEILDRHIFDFAWSSQGKLAILTNHYLFIQDHAGRFKQVSMPERDSLHSLRWSLEERIALDGTRYLYIVQPNGNTIIQDLHAFERRDRHINAGRRLPEFIKKFEWSSDQRLLVRFGDKLFIINSGIPQEYASLSLAQVLLLSKLAQASDSTYLLNLSEYSVYLSLPERIKKRYPAELPLLD